MRLSPVLEQHIRHREALFTGARQEVHDVGIEPGVVAAASDYSPNEPFDFCRASNLSMASLMR